MIKKLQIFKNYAILNRKYHQFIGPIHGYCLYFCLLNFRIVISFVYQISVGRDYQFRTTFCEQSTNNKHVFSHKLFFIQFNYFRMLCFFGSRRTRFLNSTKSIHFISKGVQHWNVQRAYAMYSHVSTVIIVCKT